MKGILAALTLAMPAFAVPNAGACKASCSRDFKQKCEKACKENAKKLVEGCIKDLCEPAVKQCEAYCEKPPPKKL